MVTSLVYNLRKALNNLYDLNYLRKSPLCRWFDLENQFEAPVRLQHILEDAIQSLKPKNKDANASHAWAIYDLLSLRYLQQFTQKEVADELGVSLSHMNRIQQKALEDLAAYLWEKYSLADHPDMRTKAEPSSAELTPPSDASATDLAWAAVPSPAKSADLNECLSAVLEVIRPITAKYAIDLDISVPGQPVEVLVYPVALRQIFLNVLTTAIHTLPDGQLSLDFSLQESGVTLQLEGRRRASALVALSDDRKTNLNVAARLAHLSEGKLDFQTEAASLHATLHLPTRATIPVLIIDDNQDELGLFERFVVDTPYRVIGTDDPRQVIPLAESTQAWVIIVDVMMPHVDGWELLQKLRHHPATADTPVVICSILRQEELADALGASAYLSKPVSQEAFLALLHRVCGHAESAPDSPNE